MTVVMMLFSLLYIISIVGAITLFFLSIFCNQKRYTLTKILLIIFELILGISIIFVFEKSKSFIAELLVLLSLIINTISLLIFNIKGNKIRKELKKGISIISIPAILCGLVFSINYIVVIIHHSSISYDEDIREIMYLEDFSKNEASELLDNLYHALRYDKNSEDCLQLYGIWEDEEQDNTYFVNIKDTCKSMYLPPNATKLILNENSKTKIERIYWQWNKDIEITLYENKKQANEYKYLYLNALYSDEPIREMKENFEKDIKDKLKAPSSAKFTYDSFRYSDSLNRFYFYGYVEAQNSYGAMLKEEFVINLLPCENEDTCNWYGLNYSWYFLDASSDDKESILN